MRYLVEVWHKSVKVLETPFEGSEGEGIIFASKQAERFIGASVIDTVLVESETRTIRAVFGKNF